MIIKTIYWTTGTTWSTIMIILAASLVTQKEHA